MSDEFDSWRETVHSEGVAIVSACIVICPFRLAPADKDEHMKGRLYELFNSPKLMTALAYSLRLFYRGQSDRELSNFIVRRDPGDNTLKLLEALAPKIVATGLAVVRVKPLLLQAVRNAVLYELPFSTALSLYDRVLTSVDFESVNNAAERLRAPTSGVRPMRDAILRVAKPALLKKGELTRPGPEALTTTDGLSATSLRVKRCSST